jgi:undecaprenyl-diphosphatase
MIDSMHALVLGLVQGFTEFLPVSSSGHLVILQQMFGIQASGEELLFFDLTLHFGTLLAVLFVFYRDVLAMIRGFLEWLRSPRQNPLQGSAQMRLSFLVILGTVPAAVIGLSFKSYFEDLFESGLAASSMLLLTGLILWMTRFLNVEKISLKESRWSHVLLVGLAQACAIIPGISRSGATIVAGLACSWSRDWAARYSFLLAIPAILGALLIELQTIKQVPEGDLLALALGVVAAAFSGFLAIRILLRVVRRGQLSWFAYYCWAVGGGALIYFWRVC